MKKITLILILLTTSFSAISQTNIQNLDIVRERLLDFYNRSVPSDEDLRTYIKDQIKPQPGETHNANDLWDNKIIGSWPDIVYNTDVKTTVWTSRTHLRRMISISRAYAEKSDDFYNDKDYTKQDLLETIYLSVDHWAANDYVTTNFPGKTIYPQQDIITTYLNVERVHPVPQSYIDKTQFIMDKAGKPKGVGGNATWRSETQVLITSFYDDVNTFTKQLDLIYQVYTQPIEGDGIQHDGSYHFHGNDYLGYEKNQVQFGNYGTAFILDMGWLDRFVGTPYTFNDFSNFGHIRNYFANGIGWTYWDDEMDYNLMPRTNDYNQTFDRARAGQTAKEILINADPSYASEYEKVLTWPNQLIGFKSFWQSDIGITRRADWYASVTMNSNKIIRGESINGENKLGLHQSDGVLMFQQSGKEFENIGALWDWKRLPGVTCDQGITKLGHPHYNQAAEEAQVETHFAGTIATKEARGMGAFINKREDLFAKKSYFFDDDVIVCIGSGINGPTKNSVITSVQQSFHIGDVKDKDGNIFTSGQADITANDWIYHDNAVYQSENPMKLDLSFVQQNWSRLDGGKNRDSEGNIFSLWIDHGKDPSGESYAYFIYPQADGTNIQERINNRPTIISNTETIQAIQIADRLYAAFYEAGSLTTLSGNVIEVDVPCLLAIDGDEIFAVDPNIDARIYYVDPNSYNNAVSIKVDGLEYNIDFSFGTDMGKQSSVQAPSAVLSTNDTKDINPVKVYPNPVKDFLFLSDISKDANIKIFDVTGREVSRQKAITGKIDTSFLAPGLHLMLIRENGIQNTVRFIKE